MCGRKDVYIPKQLILKISATGASEKHLSTANGNEVMNMLVSA